ncbi:hypothetical protein [Chryseobacterium sp. HMWF035]|uniref:hypothetical protein n=2 Tax=unclassified Chryseobacterium TaxID=2593645 RepID=UPI000D588723|nr:hypothetical protein [Chryseobacterium sp. HMWF035]PVV56688.1 hypothetical protein DD829_10340 [Chryseobacterium sp. HMWF035]
MTALKITSSLSVAAAFIIIYSLINEMQDGASFSEIAFLPFLILIAVLANAVMAVLFLAGKIKLIKEFLIIQIFILMLTGFIIFQILFNSTISD